MAATNPNSISRWALLLSRCRHAKPSPRHIRTFSTSLSPLKPKPIPTSHFQHCRHFSAGSVAGDRVIQELLAEVDREKQLEREQKRKAGIEIDDGEDEEDYMGVGPLIEKLEKKKTKDLENVDQFWKPTDSESDDDERWSPDQVKKRADEFTKKTDRHKELLMNFAEAGIREVFPESPLCRSIWKGIQLLMLSIQNMRKPRYISGLVQ